MKMVSMQGWFISHLTWCGTAAAWPCPPAPWAAGTRWPRTSSRGTPPSWRPPGCRCSGSTGWPSWRSEKPKVTLPISQLSGGCQKNSCTPLLLNHVLPPEGAVESAGGEGGIGLYNYRNFRTISRAFFPILRFCGLYNEAANLWIL